MGEIFGKGFGPFETTMSFALTDINPDTLRVLYGADLFDTKEDYINMNDYNTRERVYVLDRDALSALPTGTKIRLATEPPTGLIRESNGAWQWFESAFSTPYGNVTKSAFRDDWFPAEVLNPELMGEFKEPAPKFKVGDRVYFSLHGDGPADFPGTVEWVEAHKVGVAFDGEKYTFVQDHNPKHLTALKPEDDPRRRPLRVGDTITSAEQADALPKGSVVVKLALSATLPYTKNLQGEWVRPHTFRSGTAVRTRCLVGGTVVYLGDR